jgi:hypothetical protein
MTHVERNRDGNGLFGGLVLIGLGVLFLLDRLEIRDFGHLIRAYWPMIVVLVGVGRLFETGRFWSGLWIVGVGVWLQLSNSHFLGLSWASSWPILLMLLGGGMVVRAFVETTQSKDAKEERHES